mgnify:CR=1 FL=1
MAKSNSFFNIDMLVLSLLKVKDCYGYELVKLIKAFGTGITGFQMVDVDPEEILEWFQIELKKKY